MEKIITNQYQYAQLDWAFSIINEFMMKHDLAVLRSRKLELVMTYLGEDDED